MIEVISAIVTFVIATILFERLDIGKKITPWKSIGISILVISASLVLFGWFSNSSLVIISTVFCGVFVSSRYRKYLMNLQIKGVSR